MDAKNIGDGLRARFLRGMKLLLQRLRGATSPGQIGASVGIGLFIGCLPLYGLHLPLCLLVCLPLRLDVVAAYLAANISNPLFAPFIVFAEVEIGSYLLTGGPVEYDVERAREIGVGGFLAQAALGSVVLGGVLGVLGGLGAARLARRGSVSALEAAIQRTVERYRDAKPADRWYVASKLRVDPVLERVAALGALGRLLDAGAGRGQLGLCLLELGRVSRLEGFDFDARKVEVAKRAARGEASFETADVTTHALAGADTILLVDVLHYLEPSKQDAVLARAAAALPPGGRLVIREVDQRGRSAGSFTRLAERIGVAIGYNQSQARLNFRSIETFARGLESLGLRCTVEAASALSLSNAVLVAVKPAASNSGITPSE